MFGAFPFILFVVHTNVNCELKITQKNLAPRLRKGALHMLMGSKSHNRPESVLHTTFGYSDGMIDTVATPLTIRFIFISKSVSHLPCKNVIRVNFWKLKQTIAYGPLDCFTRRRWLIIFLAVVVVPNLLKPFVLRSPTPYHSEIGRTWPHPSTIAPGRMNCRTFAKCRVR